MLMHPMVLSGKQILSILAVDPVFFINSQLRKGVPSARYPVVECLAIFEPHLEAPFLGCGTDLCHLATHSW